MKLTILGSGGSEGIPVPFCHCQLCQKGQRRLRTSYHLRISDDSELLMEACPDINIQQLRYNFDFNYLFISHEHFDHIGGLNDLREAFVGGKMRKIKNRKKRYILISKKMDRFLSSFTHVGSVGYSYVDLINNQILSKKILSTWHKKRIKDFEITLLDFQHGSLIIDGLCIEHKGKSLVYLDDMGRLDKRTEDFIKDKKPDLVILHTPFITSQKGGEHAGIEIIKRIKAKKILISHFSHKCGLLHYKIKNKVSKYKNVIVARDRMKINI